MRVAADQTVHPPAVGALSQVAMASQLPLATVRKQSVSVESAKNVSTLPSGPVATSRKSTPQSA